jgi:hypothetical protein
VVVETVKHTRVTVFLDPATTFSWNDKSASLNDLKLGERVVVNANQDEHEKRRQHPPGRQLDCRKRPEKIVPVIWSGAYLAVCGSKPLTRYFLSCSL